MDLCFWVHKDCTCNTINIGDCFADVSRYMRSKTVTDEMEINHYRASDLTKSFNESESNNYFQYYEHSRELFHRHTGVQMT